MGGTDLELHALVASATFLRERLLRPERLGARPCPGAQPQLEQWREAVEPEGADWFEKRLRWDGSDPATAASLLAEREPEPDAPLPTWASVLRTISAAACDVGRAGTALDPPTDLLPLDPEAAVPFEHLLLPAVLVGRKMLCTRLGLEGDPLRFPLVGCVSAAAYRDLERDLLRQLSSVAGETLQSEFDDFRPFGRSLSLLLDLPDPEPGADVHYRTFVDRHLRDGWRSLMVAYPVLGRLIATAVELWVDATAELIGRLAADQDELAEAFDLTAAQMQVTGFQVSIGDRHRDGRSVAMVELQDGGRLLYKPKPLALEAAFSRLLDWCNRRGSPPHLRVTRVLDRGEYGWVEYLEQLPCEDERAAERFYRRAGMLLCLLYVVRARDCHYENLIAHADHPVLIDAETLLYPDPQPLDALDELEPGETVRDRLLTGSVLRTGFLPGWQGGDDQMPAHDSSGLGGVVSHPALRASAQWDRVNTDAMGLRLGRGVVAARGNAARIGDRTLSPMDYEAQITEGFEAMYRLLTASKEGLCAADGPLATMRAQPVRFIYRPTRVYSALTAASWKPELLRSGVEYGIHFERLARAFLVVRQKPTAWPIFAAEVRALERMDVPLFTARTDATHLDLDDGSVLADAFITPSHDRTLELVSALSETDLEQQLLVIRAALQAKAARTPSGSGGRRPSDMPTSPALASGELVSAATAIGLEIERHALSDGKQAVNWIGLTYLEGVDRYRLAVLSDSLYDGSCGVALFLAALAHVTGERRFAALALRGLHELRRRLRDSDPGSRRVVARTHGLGGGVGLGSVIYSLRRTSAFLGSDDSGLVDEAADLAGWLTPDVISDDDRLDVISGAAGALLGLLALYSAAGRASILQTAVDCGEHLLRHRIEMRGHRTWRTVAERPLTGFSHGAAGIAYALARLYDVTGERSYLEAAVEGIEYERCVFSEQHGNWPDLRPAGAADSSGFPVKWCHGASGIALARLGCSRVAEIPGLEPEIDAGLRATREHYLQDADFLCCGNLGRAETFLVAGAVTGDPESQRLAAAGTASVVARAAQTGGYRIFGAAGSYNPGFFHGTAGIGYQLLRQADPRLPSVLLWE